MCTKRPTTIQNIIITARLMSPVIKVHKLKQCQKRSVHDIKKQYNLHKFNSQNTRDNIYKNTKQN